MPLNNKVSRGLYVGTSLIEMPHCGLGYAPNARKVLKCNDFEYYFWVLIRVIKTLGDWKPSGISRSGNQEISGTQVYQGTPSTSAAHTH